MVPYWRLDVSRISFLLVAAWTLAHAHITHAGNVFTFDRVVSLRELYREFEGTFEFREVGDVALDPQRGLLYVEASEGIVLVNEENYSAGGFYTELVENRFLTRNIIAYTIEPATGNLYIYDVLCDSCVGTHLPFLAQITTLSPQGEMLSQEFFEPFRFENGVAASFSDMVFDPMESSGCSMAGGAQPLTWRQANTVRYCCTHRASNLMEAEPLIP